MNQDFAATILTRNIRSFAQISHHKKYYNLLPCYWKEIQRNDSTKPLNLEAVKAATLIQSIFRSYSVRLYLQNAGINLGLRNRNNNHHTKKEIALQKVDIDHLSMRKRNRQYLIHYCDELRQMVSDVTSRQSKSLKLLEVKYGTVARKKWRLCTDKALDEDATILLSHVQRLEDRSIHFNEIKATINEQSSFVQNLIAKSHTLTGRSYEKLKQNEEVWKEVQHAYDVVYGQTKPFEKSLLTKEKDMLTKALIQCDKVQESILKRECRRYEEELQILYSSSEIFMDMLKTILNIEMWEAERFAIHSYVMTRAKPFRAAEASIYFRLIDDNQMKLNRARKVDLPKICEVSGDFYYAQQQIMDNNHDFHLNEKGIFSINNTLVDANDHVVSITKRVENFNKKLILVQQGRHEHELIDSQSNEEIMRKRVKATQQYIQERRETLLTNRNAGADESRRSDEPVDERIHSKPSNFDKIKWNIFGSSKWFTNLNLNATKAFHSNKRKVSIIKSKLDQSTQKVVPMMKRLTMIGEDQELRLLTTVVRKTMNNQINNNTTGIISLRFTVGKEETQLFSAQNDQNESQGHSFYQSRLELGKHLETVLWVQINSANQNFITNITLKNKSSNDVEQNTTIEHIGHKSLDCILCVERNPKSSKIVSSIQITYVNTSFDETLRKDYQKIITPLATFGLADAYLWISQTDRLMKNTTKNLHRMQEQLDEYKQMLSNYPNDVQVMSFIRELERRIEITGHKEKEQRGLSHDHIHYIMEFLAMSEQDLKSFKDTFKKLDRDNDGFVDVCDIVKVTKEPLSMAPIIKECLKLSLGDSDFINDKLSFGEFTRAIGCFAMFSGSEMLKCIYCLIDKQGKGHIFLNDYYSFLAIIHPKKNMEKASRSLRDAIIPELISFPVFETLATKYPKLLFPMFRFQESMRNLCLGKKWWDRKMRKFHFAKEKVLSERVSR